MRKKQFIFIWGITGITAILLLCSSAAVLAGSSEKNMVEKLVLTRVDVMNRFYSRKMDYIDAAGELRKVETGHLLREDTSSLRKYFSTDIEEVLKCRIIRTEIRESTENMVCAVVEIQWDVKGLNGEETLKNEYFVICEKEGKKFKLVDFF